MKISTSLNCFKQIKEIYDNELQNYLGENYVEILNFWSYIDTLSERQFTIIQDKYDNIDFYDYQNFLENICLQTNIDSYNIHYSTWKCPLEKYNKNFSATIFAAYELIASSELFKKGMKLIILPLFITS